MNLEGFSVKKNKGLFEELKNSKVVVFGAGTRGRHCIECLKQMEISVHAVMDNNNLTWGKKCEDITIEKPQYFENANVILSVKSLDQELAFQAIKLGYPIDKICTYDNIIHIFREANRPIREFPHTIQLPITHLCNFDCVMCGMHKMIKHEDFSAEELAVILKDDYYSEVTSVGINGGEPFLKEDLVECVESMCDKLPHLKDLFFISNGYQTNKILQKLSQIKSLCERKGVNVHLSLSLDGIGDIQDRHRGKKGSYEALTYTLSCIKDSMNIYTDSLDIICTITKHNIFNISEVEIWEKQNNITVEYNIASENVRIENQDRLDDFSLFSDKQAQMLASEFFYSKYITTGKEKYFGLYLFLIYGRRFTECPCKTNEWITITPDAQVGFCATYSPKLGNGFKESTKELVANNLNVLYEIRHRYCEKCAHYGYKLNGEGFAELFRDDLLNNHMQWEKTKYD